MSLVQVQRSPSPSLLDDEESLDFDDSRCSSRNRSLSECYFAVRGAALILPHSESSPSCSHSVGDSAEIEPHLQLMTRHLRQQDSIKMAVRLQTAVTDHVRYLAVVCSQVASSSFTLLLGIDYYEGIMTVGMVIPLVSCSTVRLVGDGAVCVGDSQRAEGQVLFRPVSVQAMWCVFQTLHREVEKSQDSRHFCLQSVCEHYTHKIASLDFLVSQWHQSAVVEEEELELKADTVRDRTGTLEEQAVEADIRTELRNIMQSVDLDSVTSGDIRKRLSQIFGNVDVHKDFIDREMLVILGQMEKPSRIFDYLLLGSEWNASNWEELKANNVGYILNMTREVDCFFPQHFKYKKVAVSDEASTQLLSYWNSTYEFIKEAKLSGKVVLVHCKKGISRSSSTVIAYAMKEYSWTLQHALDYVKERRNCITPNRGFMEQLTMLSGALEASRKRSVYLPQNKPRHQRAVSRHRSPPSSDTVRYIVNTFERGAEESSSLPSSSRSSLNLDVVNRSSIQQQS